MKISNLSKQHSSYIHREDVHNIKAATQVVPQILRLFSPKSVLDVGCGTGTWLSVFKKFGINHIKGIDSDYVNKELLLKNIESHQFEPFDLAKPFNLNERYDLIICLEVGEHLPRNSANTFVESLSKHSDTIVFGAAVPGQWGQNHLNEQWAEYWIELFKVHNYYVYDFLRPLIWDNPNVEWWYKQNILIFSRTKLNLEIGNVGFNSLIHPDHFKQKLNFIKEQDDKLYVLKHELDRWRRSEMGVRKHWYSFIQALKMKLFRK